MRSPEEMIKFLEEEAIKDVAGGKETIEIMKSIYSLLGQVASLYLKVHEKDRFCVFCLILDFLFRGYSIDAEIEVMEGYLKALKGAKEDKEAKEKEKLH